jgi:hypothetical protein
MGSEPATATPGRRGWAVTLLAAAAVAAAVLAVGWSLQAVALPAPARGSLVATQAMSWVAGTDPIESTYTVAGAAPAHSTCVRHELRFADGNVETAALLRTGGKTQVVPVGYPFRNARGVRVGKPQGVELARLALAGCPPVLESLIGGLIKYRADPPRVGETTVAGRKTLTLRIWTKAGQIAVSLAADSKQPLTVTVSGPKLEGRATLTLGAGAT